jgi:HD-GYP domain-containing protein (c-di-GMP phosphodiesterase class II)
MRIVPINAIREGSILAKTIYNTNGTPLLKAGFELNKSLLNRALSNGFFSLYINDQYSDKIIDDVVNPEVRSKAVFQLNQSFTHLADIVDNPADINNHKVSYRESMKANEEVDNLKNMAENIINELMTNKDVMANIVDIKSVDGYTYQHSVNVAILSIIMGIEMKLNRRVIKAITVGALLHDFGKIFLNQAILAKPSALTPSEYKQVQSHPSLGYHYLKSHHVDLDPISYQCILQHHERYNGTGYPDGLKGAQVNRYAQIVSICDMYDAMSSDRPYRPAYSPNESLEYIMACSGIDFDADLVRTFVRRIIPYSVGTLVKLSTGEIGVIRKNYKNYTLRPRVDVIISEDSAGNVKYKTVELMKEPAIVIENIHYQ